MTAWLFTLLADKAGLGLTGIAAVIGVIAVAWGAVAVWLGRQYEQRTDQEDTVGMEEHTANGTA